jgi:hypothetical protein
MASLRQAMKTAGRRNPNRWFAAPGTPSPWRGRSELLLDQVGREARKTPATGCFFLASFYRTNQELAPQIAEVISVFPTLQVGLLNLTVVQNPGHHKNNGEFPASWRSSNAAELLVQSSWHALAH